MVKEQKEDSCGEGAVGQKKKGCETKLESF